MISVRRAFGILILFTSLDIVTTGIILFHGGQELNPILGPAAEYLIPAKVLFLMIVLLVAYYSEKKIPSFGPLPICGAALYCIVPVLFNLTSLIQYV